MLKLNIQDTFNKELPADPNRNNTRRQVSNACFSYVRPKKPSNPKMIHVSDEMLNAVGLNEKDATTKEFLDYFTGKAVMPDTDPYAMCYGGHQFGNWAGQLGDGRAINLAEVIHNDKKWALQLKGAGETPYSRTADGLAVLRSSIREHLCSEAMHHLGVPTTRSLSLALTGDDVLRDVLYSGNAAYESGAVVCRVAPSFIRFGNFQILAARKDVDTLKKLTDYTIDNFFPNIQSDDKKGYIEFFRSVCDLTIRMVLEWQRVGFVHGVMNTDNMSILGLTIDYGPYGWLEGYDENWTPNTTDAQGRRYRFGNQPNIVFWNLVQLANALILLIEDTAPLQSILDEYTKKYQIGYLEMMDSKLGLEKVMKGDQVLISDLLELLSATEIDMTIFYRNLIHVDQNASVSRNERYLEILKESFYNPDDLRGDLLDRFNDWISRYISRLGKNEITQEERILLMNRVNPKYVLRNYMAQLAIDKADNGDYTLIDELYQMLKKPYDEQPQYQQWFAKRPEWARNKVGCSMLSCSS